jgi:hypothetical protein
MASAVANEFELRRLAVRAKLGIDQDARSTVKKAKERKRKKNQATDMDIEDSKAAEVVEAKANGTPIEVVGPEQTSDPVIIQKRIDGCFKNQPLSEEFKTALVDTYVSNMGLNIEELGAAVGIGSGVLNGVLAEHPATLQAVRAKRAAATLDAVEQALYGMATKLRDAIAAGEVAPTSKNIRDYLIAFGILTDKHAMIAGGNGPAGESTPPETIDERKARLVVILDRADAALGLLTTGKKGNGGNGARSK